MKKIHVFKGGWMVVDIFFTTLLPIYFFDYMWGFFFMKLNSQYMYTFKLISIKLLKFNDQS